MYYVYILRCRDNSLYTGIAKDISKRLSEHFGKSDKKAKYTKAHSPHSLEVLWRCESKGDALRVEYQLKQLTKAEKETLIKENIAPEKICVKLMGIVLDRLDITEFNFSIDEENYEDCN